MYALRIATQEDYDPLRHIHHVAFRDVVMQTWGWDEHVQDQMWTEYLTETDSLQVIEVDGATAGYLDVRALPDHIFIANIALDPAMQGRGIGTRILQDILAEATAADVPVRLDVIKANIQARALYERLGFVWVGANESHDTMERFP